MERADFKLKEVTSRIGPASYISENGQRRPRNTHRTAINIRTEYLFAEKTVEI